MKIKDVNNVYVRQLLSPKNVNFHGSMFGGELYALFDHAAYIASKKVYPEHEFVTRSSECEFFAPPYPGDIFTITGRVEHKPGSSAVTIHLVGHVERLGFWEKNHHAPDDGIVSKMKFVMVSVKRKNKEFVKNPIQEKP